MTYGQVAFPLSWRGWPEAFALLKPSIDRADDHGPGDVARDLGAGVAQLWVAEDDGVKLAGVTKLVQVNDGPQCFIWHLGGEWEGHAEPLLAEVEKFARANGCASLEGNMRPGFERLLKDWKKVTVVLRKELGGGEE